MIDVGQRVHDFRGPYPLVRRALLLCGVFEAPDEVASEIAKLLAEEGAVPRLGGFTKEDIHD